MKIAQRGAYVTVGSGDVRDVGTVGEEHLLDGEAQVEVHWSTGVSTWEAVSRLRPSRVSPAQFASGTD